MSNKHTVPNMPNLMGNSPLLFASRFFTRGEKILGLVAETEFNSKDPIYQDTWRYFEENRPDQIDEKALDTFVQDVKRPKSTKHFIKMLDFGLATALENKGIVPLDQVTRGQVSSVHLSQFSAALRAFRYRCFNECNLHEAESFYRTEMLALRRCLTQIAPGTLQGETKMAMEGWYRQILTAMEDWYQQVITANPKASIGNFDYAKISIQSAFDIATGVKAVAAIAEPENEPEKLEPVSTNKYAAWGLLSTEACKKACESEIQAWRQQVIVLSAKEATLWFNELESGIEAVSLDKREKSKLKSKLWVYQDMLIEKIVEEYVDKVDFLIRNESYTQLNYIIDLIFSGELNTDDKQGTETSLKSVVDAFQAERKLIFQDFRRDEINTLLEKCMAKLAARYLPCFKITNSFDSLKAKSESDKRVLTFLCKLCHLLNKDFIPKNESQREEKEQERKQHWGNHNCNLDWEKVQHYIELTASLHSTYDEINAQPLRFEILRERQRMAAEMQAIMEAKKKAALKSDDSIQRLRNRT